MAEVLACKQCFLWAPAATRHRMPSGVSSARHFVTGGAALPAYWCKRRQRQAARQHPAGMTACDPLPSGLVATLPPLLVPAHFMPPNYQGGQKWPDCFERMRLRRVGVLSPSAPSGGTGEKEEKGIAGRG